MIPYWPQPVWTIGSLRIHAFGVVEAAALICGYALVVWRARHSGLDDRRTGWLFLTMLVAGLGAGAAVNHALAGGSWLKPGESAAGMIAGVLAVAAAAVLRFGAGVLPHLDVLASAAPVIGGMARFGCFLAHDHRGRLNDGPFAVRFPEGSRIDIGLFECVVALAAIGPVWWLWRSRTAPGTVTAVVVAAGIALRIAATILR